jgi:AcrR family transcriptional regulator
MTADDRRLRERTAQRRLIVSTARTLAERESWDAVTTRRLSTEIEYSQPVIYRHFASLDDLAEAVALDGFAELAEALGRARNDAAAGDEAPAVARAYDTYAVEHPALYDVMFTRATRLRFGPEDTPPPLAAAYAELRTAVETIAGDRDVDTLAEVLWAALHGLVLLDRGHRLRTDHHRERLDLLVAQLRDR